MVVNICPDAQIDFAPASANIVRTYIGVPESHHLPQAPSPQHDPLSQVTFFSRNSIASPTTTLQELGDQYSPPLATVHSTPRNSFVGYGLIWTLPPYPDRIPSHGPTSPLRSASMGTLSNSKPSIG
jgi:hypothetical protein